MTTMSLGYACFDPYDSVGYVLTLHIFPPMAGTRQIRSLHAASRVSPIEAGDIATRALQIRAPAQSAPSRSGAIGCAPGRSGLVAAARPTDSGSQWQPTRQMRAAAACTQ